MYGVVDPRTIQNPKLLNIMYPRMKLQRGFRVKVPRGTKKVYIPRKDHYCTKVYTEEQHFNRLNKQIDSWEPCVVMKGINGWSTHTCPYHPLVIIEEQ